LIDEKVDQGQKTDQIFLFVQFPTASLSSTGHEVGPLIYAAVIHDIPTKQYKNAPDHTINVIYPVLEREAVGN